MRQQEFEISIDKQGKVKLHIHGVKGKKCLEVAKEFEKIIGKIVETKQTSEFYEPETEVNTELKQRSYGGDGE